MDEDQARNVARGVRLELHSRVVYKRAIKAWYIAMAVEFGVVIALAIATNSSFSPRSELLISLTGLVMVIAAYLLKLYYEWQYDLAETMRRQSVLSEGLAWPIDDIQYADWLSKARLSDAVRDDDYYETDKPVGAKRLRDMLEISTFYTRSQYEMLCGIVLVVVVLLVFGAGIVLCGIVTVEDEETRRHIGTLIISAVLPIIITGNFVGWFFRLFRMASSIKEIEKELNKLERNPSERKVLRLFAEYNCQLAGGFPIPGGLYEGFFKPRIERIRKHRKS